MQLGQILLREGLIDGPALDRALARQRVQGGHLGTNLLAEGAVTEHHLLSALGRQQATPVVEGAELEDIPQEILGLVPRELARRHGVIPFRRRGGTVCVAAIDPANVEAEARIAELTSCLTRTYVGLELRVREALDRYYGIERDERLVELSQRLTRRPTRAPSPPAAEPSQSLSFDALRLESLFGVPPAPEPSPPPPALASTSAAALTQPISTPGVEARQVPDSRPEPSTTAVTLREVPDEARSAPEQESDPTPPSEPTSEEPTGLDERTAAPVVELEAATVELRDAATPDEIIEALFRFVGQHFTRSLLLIRRRDRIVAWRARGLFRGGSEELRSPQLSWVTVPAGAPSIFFSISKGAKFWIGPLPPLPSHAPLLELLGPSPPTQAVVLPISIRGRVVAYLYADNPQGPRRRRPPLGDLRRLMQKAGLAFEVCLLHRKMERL